MCCCSIIKKAHNEREKMRAKSTCIKRTKEAYTKGTMIDEIVVKSSSNFTQEVLLLWPHAFPKKDILVRSSVNSPLTFTQKSRSLSLVKFVPSSSSSSCSCCSRAIEARKTKREPPPRARARSLRNGIIRKDVQFGTTTTSTTTTFSLCVAEDVDDDVVFYRHQQQE